MKEILFHSRHSMLNKLDDVNLYNINTHFYVYKDNCVTYACKIPESNAKELANICGYNKKWHLTEKFNFICNEVSENWIEDKFTDAGWIIADASYVAEDKLTVRQLVDFKMPVRNWSINIYDKTGMHLLGYLNPVYCINEILLDLPVCYYKPCTSSIYIITNVIIDADYQSAERAEMDGYKSLNNSSSLYEKLYYRKDDKNISFALVK